MVGVYHCTDTQVFKGLGGMAVFFTVGTSNRFGSKVRVTIAGIAGRLPTRLLNVMPAPHAIA